MSIKLMSAIFETEMRDLEYTKDGEPRKTKASTAKLVLLALADHANDYGESAYPGYARLETKTALSRQGLADTFEALKQNGLLEIGVRASRIGTNDYTINIRAFPPMFKEAEELPQVVKPLDNPPNMAESSHLTDGSQATLPVAVKPLDQNHQLTTSKSSMPLDWKLGHGQPITQAELDTAQFKDKAQKQFEAAFQFGKLPWDSTHVWEKFSRFVCLVYRDDPQAFGNYIVWRAGDGKYSAMNNKQIRLNPQVFIDTWPEFVATVKPVKPQINTEAVEDTKRRLAAKEEGKRYVPPPDSVRARLGKLTADKSVKGV